MLSNSCIDFVSSSSPCCVRAATNTPAEADRRWSVQLAKFKKSQFTWQPFSIPSNCSVSAHVLACELQSRTHPRIDHPEQRHTTAGEARRRGSSPRTSASFLVVHKSCQQRTPALTRLQKTLHTTHRNVCKAVHCKHNPKCFMPLAGPTVSKAAGQHSPSPEAAAEFSPTKSQLKNQSLKRELAAAKEAQRAREAPPPSRRGREERSHQWGQRRELELQACFSQEASPLLTCKQHAYLPGCMA
jgi:hypothetical protein